MNILCKTLVAIVLVFHTAFAAAQQFAGVVKKTSGSATAQRAGVQITLTPGTVVQEGDRIKKGEVFAEFGIPFENGQWPPHLHFQIIVDMDRGKGDYPGVCKFSEKESYLANSPNPDLILQMMQYAKGSL